MIPPPPSSTLFPYTTLFRSLSGGVCVLDEGNRMNEKSWASLAPLLDHRRFVESIVAGIQIKASDRKSTRLNSSHTVNSYGVSCSKKNNVTGLRWIGWPGMPS